MLSAATTEAAAHDQRAARAACLSCPFAFPTDLISVRPTVPVLSVFDKRGEEFSP